MRPVILFAWLIAYSLGIQRDEPGFKHFNLQPGIDPSGKMTYAKGHYDSVYGRIESGWEVKEGKLYYEAIVPANTSATLYLPARSSENVMESDQPAAGADGVTFLRYSDGIAVFNIQSGRYRFISDLP